VLRHSAAQDVVGVGEMLADLRLKNKDRRPTTDDSRGDGAFIHKPHRKDCEKTMAIKYKRGNRYLVALRRGVRLAPLAGIAGVVCLAWAVSGFYRALVQPEPSVQMPVVQTRAVQTGVEQTEAAEIMAAQARPVQPELVPSGQAVSPPEEDLGPGAELPVYYPMEVGRFWVYGYSDPHSGAAGTFSRQIERRQDKGDDELFFYGDGALVYRRGGKVFEMDGGGGVNVIPVKIKDEASPYVYRSEGLRIEKSFGAVDTTVVVEGRSYSGCIEILTHCRAAAGEKRNLSYASYYAPGIGLVGRRAWPGREADEYWLALRDYGVRNL
jgi:hypothetical protein